jgi:Effector protein
MALVEYNSALFPGIKIDDQGLTSTFLLTCKEALDRIASQPLGLRLLQEISARAPTFGQWPGKVKIYRAALPIEQGGSKAAAVNEAKAMDGTGSASGVAWNSNVFVIPDQGPRPPFIGLAHELIHAWHNAYGIKKDDYKDEENFTVGLKQYMMPDPAANPATITENMIRLEHGVPIRHRY